VQLNIIQKTKNITKKLLEKSTKQEEPENIRRICKKEIYINQYTIIQTKTEYYLQPALFSSQKYEDTPIY
jgi:hypothetical protein